MIKKIIWEKWIDPFFTNEEEEEPQKNDNTYKDSYEIAEEKAKDSNNKTYNGPVIVGPMGIIPLNEHNIPSKVYCFWMGHTNFTITEKVQHDIAKVDGVEALDVFSRYRFRLAVGKAFLSETDPTGRSVLTAVQDKVCPKVKKSKQEKRVVTNEVTLDVMKKHMNNKYPYWIIFSKPDGTFDTKGANTKEELILEFDKRNDEAVATSWE